MKILFFLFLVLISGIIFSLEIVVFSDVRSDDMHSEDKKYLYCLINLEDEKISSSSLFVIGKDLFLSLSSFRSEKRIISVVEIPNGSVFNKTEYELFINLETEKGIKSEKKKLLALNGLLMPYNPSDIPFDDRNVKNHYVMSGEYIYKIAQDYGVSRADVELLNPEKVNNLHAGDKLRVGEVLFSESPYEIQVALKKCTLKLFYLGVELITFPVAVGRGNSTDSGIYTIKRMVEDPALYWEGEYIKPLSPINGLGKWWLELSNPQYGIHGTNKPWEIGKKISHGCIRMWNEDVSLLQKLIPIGTRVTIK